MKQELWSSGTPSTAAGPRPRREGDDAGRAAGRPGYLIMDVAGAFMPRLGGWLPVAHLVALMGQLGVEEQAVRSAVSRITKRGLLEPETRRGVRGYRLSDTARPLLVDADRRIFSSDDRAILADGWVLASFSVPEEERDRRHQLRARLSWLGFGNLSNGLWIAPARILPELEESVRRFGFEEYVTVFRGDYLGFEDQRALVARCWDLDGLREMYGEFLEQWTPARRRWARARRVDGGTAFVDYTLLLNQWRKFPYLDPGLPLELLPRGWEGQRAAEVFFTLRDKLERPALEHVAATADLPLAG